MSISKELRQVRIVVEKALRDDPRLRDSDKLLACHIWKTQVGGKTNLKIMSAWDLLVKYSTTEELFNQESIGRARRELQKEFPELQGKKYKERHKEELEVRRELGYNAREESGNI